MFKTIVKTIIKSISKYVGKYFLRRSGVFGIYGTFKSVGGFKKFIKEIRKQSPKVVKKIIKKNFLRSLHSANFIRDWKKFGIKETAKRVFTNRLVPMEVRKLGYFFKEIKGSVDRQKLKINLQNIVYKQKEDGRKLITRANIHIDRKGVRKQVKFIDEARNFRPKNEEEKQLIGEFKQKYILFNVKSPETHNFNRKIHRYDQLTSTYIVPIRSGSHKYVKSYDYQRVPWYIVRQGILDKNYGRNVFSQFRKK